MSKTTLLLRKSRITGGISALILPLSIDDFREREARWKQGEYVQDAFDNLDAPLREFIKTGITPDEWNEMFGVCKR